MTTTQILGLTADNASNMDKMSECLEVELLEYSSVNRTRCFNHILNLIGKALLMQFDIKKKKGDTNDDDDLSDEETALLELAEDLDEEELTMRPDNNEADIPDDDLEEIEAWVDEVSNELSIEERAELTINIRPIRCVLVKV